MIEIKYCHICDGEHEVETVVERGACTVRGKSVEYDCEYYRCPLVAKSLRVGNSWIKMWLR